MGREAGIVRCYRLRLPWRKRIFRLRKRDILREYLAQKYISDIRSRSNVIYSISIIQPFSVTLTLKEAVIKIGTPTASQQWAKFGVSNKICKLHRLVILYHISLLQWPTPNVEILHKLWFTSPCRELHNAGICAFCDENQHMLRCNNTLHSI